MVPAGVCVRRFSKPVPTRGIGLWWRPSAPRAELSERIGALLVAGRP